MIEEKTEVQRCVIFNWAFESHLICPKSATTLSRVSNGQQTNYSINTVFADKFTF